MLIVGSYAMSHFGLTDRKPRDIDIIGTFEEYENLIKSDSVLAHYPLSGKKFFINLDNTIIEFELAWPDSIAEELINIVTKNNLYKLSSLSNEKIVTPDVQLTLKLSHRYLKNNPHFLKTMKDIHTLRYAGYSVPECLKDWLVEREKETYNYSHPKLNQNKKNFFDTEGVKYKYDHDSIHKAVAVGNRPAYLEFKPEDEDVWCCKKMWDKCSTEIKINAAYEESCVLALERCLIPFDFKTPPKIAFLMALEKVCTSITSGWFREYVWENYYAVVNIYDRLGDYHIAFLHGLDKGIVKKID